MPPALACVLSSPLFPSELVKGFDFDTVAHQLAHKQLEIVVDQRIAA